MTVTMPADGPVDAPREHPPLDRSAGLGRAVAAVALLGLVAGWWTPRGPVTTPEALATIGISLLVGALAGRVMRTRWAVLVAPLVFAVTFELVRAGTFGPLMDSIHLGSDYGILAFALGRGFHAVLALVPMMFGAAVGAARARHLDASGCGAGPDGSGCGPDAPSRWSWRWPWSPSRRGSAALRAPAPLPAQTVQSWPAASPS